MTTDTPQPIIVRLTLDIKITDQPALLRYVEHLHAKHWVVGFAEANPHATIADAAMEGLVLLHRDPRDGGTDILSRSASVWTGDQLDRAAPLMDGLTVAAAALHDAYALFDESGETEAAEHARRAFAAAQVVADAYLAAQQGTASQAAEEAAALAELDAYLVAQKDTSIPRKD